MVMLVTRKLSPCGMLVGVVALKVVATPVHTSVTAQFFAYARVPGKKSPSTLMMTILMMASLLFTLFLLNPYVYHTISCYASSSSDMMTFGRSFGSMSALMINPSAPLSMALSAMLRCARFVSTTIFAVWQP